MTRPIHLAISTCPNDTFAFHGILAGKVDTRGFDFHVDLCDVQELNEGLFEGRYDVAKASFHAALRLSHDLMVFDSGSALGFGVGPLLLARSAKIADAAQPSNSNGGREALASLRVLCPGEHTTASLLLRLFFPSLENVDQVIFSDIMPALQSKDADLGVCIHEGRFTWKEQGLHLVADLGDYWEQKTSTPLPLGGIVGRRSLALEDLSKIQSVIQDSVAYGHAHREETLNSMRKYAQEFDDSVLFAHVDLYVNDWTFSLGNVGENALRQLHQLAIEMGVIEKGQPQLERIVGANE